MTKKVIITKEVLENISKLVKDSWNPTVSDIIDLVVRKNHDYGDAWQRYKIFTPLIRINDKILRVKTLSSGEQALVADEKIEDTLKDIIGYSLLALEYLRVHPRFLRNQCKRLSALSDVEEISSTNHVLSEAQSTSDLLIRAFGLSSKEIDTPTLTQLPLFPEQKLEIISNMVNKDDADDEDTYEEGNELV